MMQLLNANRSTIRYGLAGGLLVATGLILFFLKTQNTTNVDSALTESKSGPKAASSRTEYAGTTPDRKLGRSAHSYTKNTFGKVSELVDRWKALSDAGLSTQELWDSKNKITMEAFSSLSGESMAAFLDGLMEVDAGSDVNRAMSICVSSLIAMGDEKVMAWLTSIENHELQNTGFRALGISAGQCGNIAQLTTMKQYATSESAVDAAVKGYCYGAIVKDPTAAVKSFFDNKRKEASISDLRDIMRELPKKSDFAEIEKMLPDDSKSVAKEVRSSLLASWAGYSPREAAEFVTENLGRVSESQIGIVMNKWVKTSPREAQVWSENLPAGPAKDGVLNSVTGSLASSDPQRAWTLCDGFSDPKKQDAARRQVYEHWADIDRAQAEVARKSLESQ